MYWLRNEKMQELEARRCEQKSSASKFRERSEQ